MHSRSLGILLSVPLTVLSLQIPLREPRPDSPPKPRGNPLGKEFGDYVNGLLEQFKVPSLTIAIVDGDETYSAAYGTAVFPDTPATPETLYYTGSTTKSFVAASYTILRDWSANTSEPLQLSDPLHKYIDSFRLASDYATLHTTLEDALSHRSGLPRHDLAYGGPNYTFHNLIEALPHLPLTAEPRTTFQYCNIMFMVLSHALENFTRTSLGKFLKENVWEPFGMHYTYFSLAEAQAAEKADGRLLARGYYWNTKTNSFDSEPWVDSMIISGAGNTISNVLDYARYLSGILNERSPISKAGYQDLKLPRTIVGPVPLPAYNGNMLYTLGWQTVVYRGHEIYFHGGGLSGFGASMLYMPSKNWAITMMGNTELRSNLVQQLIEWKMMDDLLEVPPKERLDLAPALEIQLQIREIEYFNSSQRLFPDRPKPIVPVSRPIEDYAGLYHHPAYQNVTLSLAKAQYPFAGNDTVLTIPRIHDPWTAKLQFEHVSGDHFVVWVMPLPDAPSEITKEATRGEFRVAANGHVEALGIAAEPEMRGEMIWFDRID